MIQSSCAANHSYISGLKSITCKSAYHRNSFGYYYKLLGSEKKLHEFADELILSLMDYDTIHAAMQQQDVRPPNNPKTILSITT